WCFVERARPARVMNRPARETPDRRLREATPGAASELARRAPRRRWMDHAVCRLPETGARRRGLAGVRSACQRLRRALRPKRAIPRLRRSTHPVATTLAPARLSCAG